MPVSGVENDAIASMFRFVAKSSTGFDSPTIVTLASTGSHAGWRIGRCSMR